MEGAAVKLREASRHLCTDLTGHPGPQLSDCVLGVGSPVQNKWVVELPLGSLAAVCLLQERPKKTSVLQPYYHLLEGNFWEQLICLCSGFVMSFSSLSCWRPILQIFPVVLRKTHLSLIKPVRPFTHSLGSPSPGVILACGVPQIQLGGSWCWFLGQTPLPSVFLCLKAIPL